jgi:excisionase family DNA binding protein
MRACGPQRRCKGGGVSAPLKAEDVMRAGEVAALLHIPVSTVHDWARRGLLPSRKIGRHRLYIRQQIEAVLLSGD